MIGDLLMLLKLFVFFLFVQWLLGKVTNKAVFVMLMLLVGYYIFFEQWSILGTLMVLFLVFLVGGLGSFMQDIIFQYTTVPGAEEREIPAMYPPYMIRR